MAVSLSAAHRGIYALDLRAAPEEPTPPVSPSTPVGGTVYRRPHNMTLTALGVGGLRPDVLRMAPKRASADRWTWDCGKGDSPTLTILNTTLLAEGFYEVVAFNSAGEEWSASGSTSGVSLPGSARPRFWPEWSSMASASTTTSERVW